MLVWYLSYNTPRLEVRKVREISFWIAGLRTKTRKWDLPITTQAYKEHYIVITLYHVKDPNLHLNQIIYKKYCFLTSVDDS